jgi:hypothetical protein
MEPMDDAFETGRIERYRGDQLVVDLGDLGLVEDELGRLGMSCPEPDEDHKDDRLQLALLELPGLTGEKAELLRKAGLTDGEPDPALEGRVNEAIERATQDRAEHGLAPELPELDLLLHVLRVRFAYRYEGWTPTIGKNRGVELAKGSPHLGGGLPTPHLGGGGEGDPQPVDPPAEFSLDADELAQQAQVGRGIRVAILDTAVWLHPFLVGRFIAPPGATVTAVAPGTIPWVTAGHATFASGLVLLRAPGAQLEVHQVLDDRAIGDVWDGARKIAEVAASGVHIMNLSWGCYTDDGQPPLVLARAVERLGPEVVVVAAAGNHARRFPDEPLGPQTPSWPAAFDRVTAVGASVAGQLAWFSPKAPWVDLLAPGVDVVSTYLTGEVRSVHVHEQGDTFDFVEELLPKPFYEFAKWSGTSFATATVSGQIAAHATSGSGTSARQALDRLSNPQPGQQPGSDIRPFTLQDLER